MKQRAIKMPDDLWAAVQKEAVKVGLTAGEFVRLAVEEKLDLPEPQIVSEEHSWSGEESVEKSKWLAEVKRGPPEVIQGTTASPVFKCPVYGCHYEAASQAARCPHHGRTVIPN